jgi:GNAT superfamily N-acetyltransferase
MATTADARALAQLRLEFRASIGEPEEDDATFLARCTDWMDTRLRADSRWRAWIAERDSVILGTVWIGLIEKIPNPIAEPEENGYLTNFYVVPRAQGMGIGTALLDAALAWCREREVHAVILWPTTRSRPLYERHGFAQPTALMEKVVTGEGAPWPSAHAKVE